MNLKKDIAKNIRKYRKKEGLTQKDLGNLIGRSEVSVRKYESGDVAPGIEMIDKIAEALGISAYLLLHGNQMEVKVSVKDVGQFELFIDMMKDMLTDERIDKLVREEYYHRYLTEVE